MTGRGELRRHTILRRPSEFQTDHFDEGCCCGADVPKVALVFNRTLLGGIAGGWACDDCLAETSAEHPYDEIVWVDAAARSRVNAEYAVYAAGSCLPDGWDGWDGRRRFCRFLRDRAGRP